jgi:hypothetical protein
MSDVANEDFVGALVASGPTSNYPERMRRFGQLVGTWSIASRTLNEDTQEWSESELTWTFAYILDGRAVQDVLSGPSRVDSSLRPGARPSVPTTRFSACGA